VPLLILTINISLIKGDEKGEVKLNTGAWLRSTWLKAGWEKDLKILCAYCGRDRALQVVQVARWSARNALLFPRYFPRYR
jgi:hypothetical protein